MGIYKRKVTNRVISVLFAISLVLSLTYILWTHIANKEGAFVFDDANVEQWNDLWDINYDGTIEQGVSLPIDVPIEKGHAVMLRKTLPEKIKEYNCIMFDSKHQDVVVSIDGIERAEFSNKDYRPWGKSSPSGIVMVPLYNSDSLSDVTIHISSDSIFSGHIGNIYIGSEKSLVVMLLKSNMLWIIFAAIVFVLGIICFVSFYAYAPQFKIGKALLYIAVLAVLSSIWSFTQSAIKQVFVNDLTSFEALGYCCYMLIPMFLLLYVNWITNSKYVTMTKGLIILALLNYVIENILQVTLKLGFYEMRYASQAIFVIAILFVLLICVKEIGIEFNAMTRSLLVGTVGLLFGVLTEIAYNNFNLKILEIENLYIGGALVFIGAEFIYIALCIGKEQRERKDAESANLAKSMFLASMSHEIKTPINVVIGMNEMILRDSSEDNIREYAANISEAGESLLTLVNDILDYSKIEVGKMEINPVKYNLKSIIKDSAVMTKAKIGKKNIEFLLDIDENIPLSYLGDEIRIRQVLNNLLSNAVKYTEKGKIIFTIKNNSIHNGEISLGFSVKDTGIGIKPEDVERLMGSFARIEDVKNSSIGGTGLGLAITTQLLDMMGSRLSVESEYGKGSDFSFVIRQKIVDQTPMGPVEIKVERKLVKKKIDFTAPEARILVVDDNRTNIAVLKGLLKPTKMTVDAAESGRQCLDLSKINYYDIIFMDHMMPQMDGIETFKNLKGDKGYKSHDSKVVVLTANTVSGAEQMYKEVGFDYYFKKPIDVNELKDVLKKYIPERMIYD